MPEAQQYKESNRSVHKNTRDITKKFLINNYSINSIKI